MSRRGSTSSHENGLAVKANSFGSATGAERPTPLIHVGKNGRVYHRKFDHDEAKKRYEAGESVAGMAREFGVHVSAVWQVVSPRIVESQRRLHERLRAAGECERCGGWKNGLTQTALCHKCAMADRVTSVRPTTLRCGTCREWKSDGEFAGARTNPARRDRHDQCRPCSTKARREYRQRNREADNAYERAYRARRRAEQRVTA